MPARGSECSGHSGAARCLKLLALPRYARLGASSRVRFSQYYPSLGRLLPLEHIAESALLSDDYLRRKYSGSSLAIPIALGYWGRIYRLARKPAPSEVYWLEKEALPWAPAWFERLLLQRPYVLDLDDAIFHTYDRHPNGLLRRLYARKIDRLMRRAALVTAGNDYLAARAREAGASWVEVLPTVIDLEHYPLRERAMSGDVFTVGWVGSPATVHYLRMLEAPLQQLARERRVRLCVVGAEASMTGVETESVPWSAETEARSIARFDVGVMPLPDSPWERGKCGYKLIQYMACRLPVVASPVGVNATLVTPDEHGYLAGDDEAWYGALARLAGDGGLRARLGAAGRRRVESDYCVQVTAPRLACWLQTVAEGTRV
jgi:glycosyltransferase involved in cell wall biosynthesis